VTHQGAARDAASAHFCLNITRTGITNTGLTLIGWLVGRSVARSVGRSVCSLIRCFIGWLEFNGTFNTI